MINFDSIKTELYTNGYIHNSESFTIEQLQNIIDTTTHSVVVYAWMSPTRDDVNLDYFRIEYLPNTTQPCKVIFRYNHDVLSIFINY